MRLRCRPSAASDFKNWLQYSTVRSRYGTSFGQLSGIWASLLSKDQVISAVVEDLDAPKKNGLLALGLAIFITDEFVREAKTSPLFWIGPELIRRIKKDQSPILDSAAVRQANSRHGLNLFIWEVDVRSVPENQFLAIATDLSAAFFNLHAGFKIKELMAQHPFGPVMRAALGNGFWVLQNGNADYAPPPPPEVIETAGAPFLLGLTNEIACKVPGGRVSTLFDYRQPRIFFTPAEQRLLLSALEGHTDDDVSNELAISSSGVKKCWQSIYARVALRLPELLPDNGSNGSARGSEKKRRLLSYLRGHPEDLRPLLPPSYQRAIRQRPRVETQIPPALLRGRSPA
jgi:hypothetical protein